MIKDEYIMQDEMQVESVSKTVTHHGFIILRTRSFRNAGSGFDKPSCELSVFVPKEIACDIEPGEIISLKLERISTEKQRAIKTELFPNQGSN